MTSSWFLIPQIAQCLLPGILGADTSVTSSGRSTVPNVVMVEVAGFCLEILAVYSDVLLSSVEMSACCKQVWSA